MARTTAPDVTAALGGNYDGTTTLTGFITRASLLVDRVAACATAKGEAMTAAELTEMETLLAAHYYQAADEGYTSRSTADASGSFKGQFGKGLEATRYGQDALSLDFAGCLRAIAGPDGRKSAGGFWLGKPPSEQTPYTQRN